jgi:hypothetical protein
MKTTVVALLLTALVGCGIHESDDLNTVRDGVLNGFNTTTVGKAFDATFPDGKWTSLVSPKGVSVVEFSGTVTADALDAGGFLGYLNRDTRQLWAHIREKCLEGIQTPCRLPVKFQFLIAADKKSFEVGYIDTRSFLGRDVAIPADPHRVLAFVYR